MTGAASCSCVQRDGDDARRGRHRDAIIVVALAMERRGQNPICSTEKEVAAACEIAGILIDSDSQALDASEIAKAAHAPAVWPTLTPRLAARGLRPPRLTIADEHQDAEAKQRHAPRSRIRGTALLYSTD